MVRQTLSKSIFERSHCGLIKHSLWVLSYKAAGAGSKLSLLVLFGYAQTALNEDAILDLGPHASNKG